MDRDNLQSAVGFKFTQIESETVLSLHGRSDAPKCILSSLQLCDHVRSTEARSIYNCIKLCQTFSLHYSSEAPPLWMKVTDLVSVQSKFIQLE